MKLNRRTVLRAGVGATLLPLVMHQTALASPPGAGATNVRDYGAVGDGVVDDTQALQAALAVAQASAQRYLYMPAGIYRVSLTGGRLFDCTAQGLTIAGDGVGLTTIQVDATALVSHLRLIFLQAPNQTVRDMSIVFAPGFSGSYDTSAVEITTGALRWHVADMDISGVWGAGSAGGSGVGCYQDATVGGGQQFGICERVHVHDCPRCSAFGINSNNNTIRQCQAARVGATTQQHGYYCVSGYNLYQQCYAEACSGFSFHAHKQNSAADASGDVYDGCVSVNPGLKHMIVDGTGNPPLTRFVTVTGCVFRGIAEGIDMRVPALIEGNIFEDVRKQGQNAIVIGAGAGGSIVRGNYLKNSAGIFLGVPASAEGNTIDSVYGVGAINCAANGTIARGNRITIAGVAGVQGATGIIANVSNAIVESNLVNVTAPGTCIIPGQASIHRSNVLEPRGGAWTYTIGGNFAGPLGTDVVR